jgi:hypothetical protein
MFSGKGIGMPRRSVSTVIRSFVAVAASVSFIALSGPAWSAAYAPGQQLSQQTIAEFTANPSQLLNQFPNGGGQMISRLRDLLASDPATLAPILSLLRNATSEQKAALGAALAQAARLYQRADQAFAAQIQQAVANTQDQELIVAYAAAAGDQPIGAGGGAGSAGGPGGGSNPLGGPAFGGGALQGIGGGSVDTGGFAMTASASTGAGINTTNNNGTNAVSP